MTKNEKKETAYSILKGERDAALQENVKLTQTVKDLWAQSGADELRRQRHEQEINALKTKLEALNEATRNTLAKKNFELGQIEALKKENEAVYSQMGYKDAKIEELIGFQAECMELKKFSNDLKNENVLLIKESAILSESNGGLKNINSELHELNEGLNLEILNLKKRIDSFNEFKTVQDKAAKDKETVLNSLNIEMAKLKNENADLKKQVGAKNSKMYAFMVVVSILAIFANFTHVGAKYLSLIDNPTILNEITCYGSMLVFDLAVFLFTIRGKENAAISFAIGVFLIVFMQLGSPFLGAELSAEYAEKIISGLIYSAMFAFIPYKLSQLFTEKE